MKFETRLVGKEVVLEVEVLLVLEVVFSELLVVCIRLTVYRTPGAYWNLKAQSTLPSIPSLFPRLCASDKVASWRLCRDGPV
jgi:hypothetical protein